jgi:hypothetical protein
VVQLEMRSSGRRSNEADDTRVNAFYPTTEFQVQFCTGRPIDIVTLIQSRQLCFSRYKSPEISSVKSVTQFSFASTVKKRRERRGSRSGSSNGRNTRDKPKKQNERILKRWTTHRDNPFLARAAYPRPIVAPQFSSTALVGADDLARKLTILQNGFHPRHLFPSISKQRLKRGTRK